MGIDDDLMWSRDHRRRRGRYPGDPEETERNAEIWRLNRVERVGTLKLAQRFNVSRTRIKQILTQEDLKRDPEAADA